MSTGNLIDALSEAIQSVPNAKRPREEPVKSFAHFSGAGMRAIHVPTGFGKWLINYDGKTLPVAPGCGSFVAENPNGTSWEYDKSVCATQIEKRIKVDDIPRGVKRPICPSCSTPIKESVAMPEHGSLFCIGCKVEPCDETRSCIVCKVPCTGLVRLIEGQPVCLKCNHPEDVAPLPAVAHRARHFVPPEMLLPPVTHGLYLFSEPM